MKLHYPLAIAISAILSQPALGADYSYSLISKNPAGAAGNGASDRPKTDDFGARIAFVSNAYDLVAGDTNSSADVFVVNRSTNEISLISNGLGGVPADGAAGTGGQGSDLSISGNGEVVAFVSSATNLVADNDLTRRGEHYPDCYYHNMKTGLTFRIPALGGAVPDLSCRQVSVNYDGTRIAFASDATNLGGGNTFGTTQVYVYDTTSGMTTRQSVYNPVFPWTNPDGLWSDFPSINSSGSAVAFRSTSDTLAVPYDPNNYPHIFRRSFGTTSRIDISPNDLIGNGGSSAPSIADDGAVTFTSGIRNLVPNDGNLSDDVFLARGAAINRVSEINGAEGIGGSGRAVISANGEHTVFYSQVPIFAPNLQSAEVFLKTGGNMELISQSGNQTGVGNGSVSNANANDPDISAAGRFIVYQQTGGNIVAGLNGLSNIVLVDRAPETPANYDLALYHICRIFCGVNLTNTGSSTARNATVILEFGDQASVSAPEGWACVVVTPMRHVCTKSKFGAGSWQNFNVQVENPFLSVSVSTYADGLDAHPEDNVLISNP